MHLLYACVAFFVQKFCLQSKHLKNSNKNNKNKSAKMKTKFLLTLALTVFYTITIHAQKAENKVHEKRTERIAEELGLTEAQKTKLIALFEQQEAEYQKTKENANPNSENLKKQLQALRKKQAIEFEKIVGKEKFEIYKEKRKQEKKRIDDAKQNKPTTEIGN
jgi:Spy/CpxP family protein refolding chaperone